MTRFARSRWSVAAAASAVVAVLAVVGLVGWAVTRPGDRSGDGLEALRPAATASATPSPTTTRSGPEPTPSIRATVRDARPSSDAARPTAITIPDLGIEARIDPVGVQDDGAMVIPAAPTSVGWYEYGSAPGDPEGHTVVAGHIATREDGAGAFAPLVGAEEGMEVEVEDADGTTHRYVVRGREAIRKKALPVDEIFARDGRPVLVLITCGGEYIPELRSHRDNIVVTAVPVD